MQTQNFQWILSVQKWKTQQTVACSVAQKIYQAFFFLGVDPFVIADVMLYNIEIVQTSSNMI
jgi:hypothetical protein